MFVYLEKSAYLFKERGVFVYLESVQKGESLRERGALSAGRMNGKVPPARWCSLEIGARMFGSKHYKKQVQSCEWPCLLASLVCLQARFGACQSLCRLSIHLCPVLMLHYILSATYTSTHTHLECTCLWSTINIIHTPLYIYYCVGSCCYILFSVSGKLARMRPPTTNK